MPRLAGNLRRWQDERSVNVGETKVVGWNTNENGRHLEDRKDEHRHAGPQDRQTVEGKAKTEKMARRWLMWSLVIHDRIQPMRRVLLSRYRASLVRAKTEEELFFLTESNQDA
jgi:hypothetical protein